MSAVLPHPGAGLSPIHVDHALVRARTRKTMLFSGTVHTLLLLWLLLIQPATRPSTELTEVLLLDPGDLQPAAAAAPAAPAAAASPGLARASTTEERFTRRSVPADVEPVPQVATMMEDRLAARLASLQQAPALPISGLAPTGAPGSLLGSPTGAGTAPGGNAPLALSRGGGTGTTGPALTLSRGGSIGAGPAVVSTGIPGGAAAATPARSGESAARRSLAGATLLGPVADRPIVQMITPVYPDWAKRDAVEGSVTLYFIVRPDGSIKENVLVQKTAGFEDFDDSARTALRSWRFAALTGGRTGEQWGTITFNFRLGEAG